MRYIEKLSIGTRISVRKIAQVMDVSEGTAYRAIKEAEAEGLVSTKERTGTVRVDAREKHQFDRLVFDEVVHIVDGVTLGGSAGLHKTLNKFVIGAMQLEAMMRYVEPGNLLIVGNRSQAHLYALEQGAGVLITGGFQASAEARELADKLELPIISSSYDTFTVATLINRAIHDRLIKKKIILVQDIIRTDTPVYYLKGTDTVQEMQAMIAATGHTRYPVVDDHHRPIGILTTKDVLNALPGDPVEQYMKRNPLTVHVQTSVASASHTMVWEGIQMLPVVSDHKKMLGVISRSDVLKAMQFVQTQPQYGESFEDLIWTGFEKIRDKENGLFFRGVITAQMTNHIGMASESVMTALMNQAALRIVKEHRRGDLILDSSSNYFLMPIPLDSTVEVKPTIIELSRRFCKIEVEIVQNGVRMAKSMFTARLLD
ncbi:MULTISPECIES: DRTGG domain-containing protein [unclassified Paenibacillus]|uniref:DRTGG domain-containing protein n=1 Tax=unclassified Paenibacillus TaxID=185978 RepID=UPI000930C579|nr:MULTISPECIES: DRTGG domain-containing protein [unclassified Paenibacillus]